MRSILIIKLGAKGDVIRTTPLLRRIKGDVTWVTYRDNIPLLHGNAFIKRVVAFDEYEKILKDRFDWVINLEEEWKARALSDLIKADKKTSWNNEWCYLSINDKAKKRNRRSYQYFMFRSLGMSFREEEYVLNTEPDPVKDAIIGIERRIGNTWSLKLWDKYDQLARLLKRQGFKVKIFKHRDNIKDYLKDINSCRIIVTGDTLAMHLGLGLRKKVVALFGPTSSSEIYAYGRMRKIVSGMHCQCCYRKRCSLRPNCMDNISVKEVFDAILDLNEG